MFAAWTWAQMGIYFGYIEIEILRQIFEDKFSEIIYIRARLQKI